MIRQRLLIAVLLLVAGCGGMMERSLPSSASPTANESTAGQESELPKPNVRGRDISAEAAEEGDHPAPIVLPRKPLELVINDCDGFQIFSVDNYSIDETNGLLNLSWWDPGAHASRSLAIYYRSASCWRNLGVVAAANPSWFDSAPPRANVDAKEIRVLRTGGLDPSAEVLPRRPLHLVIDSCKGLKLFDSNDTVDRDSGILTLDWFDPYPQVDRMLTIFVGEPSCWSHDGVRARYSVVNQLPPVSNP